MAKKLDDAAQVSLTWQLYLKKKSIAQALVAESIQKHDSKMWADIHRGGKEGPKKFWHVVKHKFGSGPKLELHLPEDSHASEKNR